MDLQGSGLDLWVSLQGESGFFPSMFFLTTRKTPARQTPTFTPPQQTQSDLGPKGEGQEPLPAFWALKQKPIVATRSRTCSLGPLHANHWRLQFCGVPISPCGQHRLRFMNLLDVPKVCKGQTENLSARDRAEQCIQNSRLDHGTKKPSGSETSPERTHFLDTTLMSGVVYWVALK